MDVFFHIADEILLLYISISSIYLFIFAMAAQFRKSGKYPQAGKRHRYAVLIPEDNPYLAMDYPEELYRIFSTQAWTETVATLSEEEFDAVVVLGESIQVSPGFLTEINQAYDAGVKVIQLHHQIEPRSSIGKKLTAIHEEVKNSLFKQGHTAVGISSALDGIDMVLDLGWLKKNLKSSKTNLELRSVKQNLFVEYLEYVTVYSPKVRVRRYVLSRGKAASRFFPTLFSGNWNYVSILFQRFIPSWVVLLLLCTLLAIFFTCTSWSDSIKWWGIILFLLFIMCLGIPDYLVEKKKKSKNRKNGK